MSKSCKFFKFLTFFSIFAMVLTVGLAPTVASASDDVSLIYPDNGSNGGYRMRVEVETLEYGQWVTKLYQDVYDDMDDFSWVFDIDAGLVDHTSENFRVRLIYEYHGFLKTNTYEMYNYFEFGYGSDDYYMSFAKMNVYSSVDDFTWLPLYGNVALNSNYPEFRVSVTPFQNCGYICVEFVSDFHQQFQTGGVGRDQCYFMIGMGNEPISYKTFIPQYPDLNLPDADVDGLQDFSGYAPSGELQQFFDAVFRYRFVSIGMLMLVTMGVLGFLLFGERK